MISKVKLIENTSGKDIRVDLENGSYVILEPGKFLTNERVVNPGSLGVRVVYDLSEVRCQ